MTDLQYFFQKNGFVVARSEKIRKLVTKLKLEFESSFQCLFGNDSKANRNLIRRFADSVLASRLFASSELIGLAQQIGLRYPIFCGPPVSHYTHYDHTGNSYGLPWHQDFPSMASSSNSIIVWVSINDCSSQTHSIEVAPELHRNGILPGVQSESGYILSEQAFPNSHILSIPAGDILLFSPFLPHRTFVNPNSKSYKLSLSRRFDDLSCKEWHKKGFDNAYRVTVDRSLYTKFMSV
jgi:hypothetical protein